MKSIEQQFAENLRFHRSRRGLTQKALAEALGYSEKSVSKWETGKAVAPGAMLPALAEALQITIDALFSNTEEPEYFLGIDGGGTKTAFLLADRQGQVLGRATLGASHPGDVGIEETARVLEEGIRQVCGSIPLSKISVFAGIAGGITGNNQRRIREVLEGLRFARADNNTDALNAVAAGLGDEDGVTVILGTGSIIFAKHGTDIHRIGGFGFLLEDAASGYAIGRDGIVAALRAEEGSGPATVLLDKVLEHCGTRTVVEAIGAFYEGKKKLIAGYATAVFEAAAEGDAVATDILRRQMQGLADGIRAAAAHLPADQPVKVVFLGGVTRQAPLLFPLLEPLLPTHFTLSVCQAPPVLGALRLAGLKDE